MTLSYAVESKDLQYEDIKSITGWTNYGFYNRKYISKYYLPPPHDSFHLENDEVLQVIQPEYITKEKFLLLIFLGEFEKSHFL